MRTIEYIAARPAALREAIEAFPLALVPLGSLEWHGPHLPLGFDGLKAEALLRDVHARLGKGVLFPTMYWHAFHVMNFPYTFSFRKHSVKPIVKQLHDMGFRILVLLAGHYPSAQVANVRSAATWLMNKHRDAYALGIPEQHLLLDTAYAGDHAAMGETSLALATCPDLVDMTAFPQGLTYMERATRHGVMGKDPASMASAQLGKELAGTFTSRLVDLIHRTWQDRSQAHFRAVHENARKAFSPLRFARRLDDAIDALGMDSRRDLLGVAGWFLSSRARRRPRP